MGTSLGSDNRKLIRERRGGRAQILRGLYHAEEFSLRFIKDQTQTSRNQVTSLSARGHGRAARPGASTWVVQVSTLLPATHRELWEAREKGHSTLSTQRTAKYTLPSSFSKSLPTRKTMLPNPKREGWGISSHQDTQTPKTGKTI